MRSPCSHPFNPCLKSVEALPCGVRITTSVTIQGMLSVHAAHAVFTALTGVEGISTADVKVGRATIEHDGRATHEQIIDAIETAGYVVTDIRDERRLPLLDH